MLRLWLKSSVLFGVLFVSACSVSKKDNITQYAQPYSPLLAQASAPVPTVDDLFRLSEQQQAEFLSFFNASEQQHLAPNERLQKFLSGLLIGFHYQGHNYTATEAYRLKQGNCISLAVLTNALARLAGVDISFQQVVSSPVFDVKGDWFVSADHVRTFLYADPPSYRKDKEIVFRPYIIVDYFPELGDIAGLRISEATFIAMFYRNLAADALLEDKLELALALLREALRHDPGYSAVINLTALVHKKLAEQQLADLWFQYGLKIAANKTTLLNNYAVFMQNKGDIEAAELLRQQLQSLEEQDPFLWYIKGKTALLNKDYEQAIKSFTLLTESAPYLAEFHYELAKAYFYTQRFDDARKALSNAADAAVATDKPTFNAKLEALKHYASEY